MEKEGFKRGIAAILENGVKIHTISTDRNIQIRKLMREKYAGIQHEIDPWHVIKGLSKKLGLLSKKKDCERISN